MRIVIKGVNNAKCLHPCHCERNIPKLLALWSCLHVVVYRFVVVCCFVCLEFALLLCSALFV